MAVVTERVREHRNRLRAQGLRPVQLWLPDTSTAEFRHEARRQSLAAVQADQYDDTQKFINTLQEEEWDKLPPYDWESIKFPVDLSDILDVKETA